MKNTKDIMIAALLIAVVALAVGYAAFATTLTVNGHAVVDANWQVEIISITPSYSGTAEETVNSPVTPKYTATTATFDATLKAPGDKATYSVVVKNKGSIKAKLNAITPSAADLATLNAAAPAVVTYSIKSAPALNSVLNPNDTATFEFEVVFDPNTTVEQFAALTGTIEKSLTATMEYVQDTSSASSGS